jgi:mono/diheme cytochrome c family protein
MKRLVLLLALVVSACTGSGSQKAADVGLTVFHTRCSRCHGADGRGAAVFNTPVLTVSKLTEAQMAEVILKGRNKMPAFSLELTPEEIAATASYVKNGLR